MRAIAAVLLLLASGLAMADDEVTSPTLSLGAVFSTTTGEPATAAVEDTPTSDALTLRSLLAEPTPAPAGSQAAPSRETRLSAPLRWSTADPDNRLPFRAPPAEWFRAPEEVIAAAQVRAERPDPMLELMRLHGGKLPPLAQRGFGNEGPTERIRQVSTPFLRITGQGTSVGVDGAHVEIVNATRETPARVVIEPVAPTAPAPGEPPQAPPSPALVLLLPPGTTERLVLPAGSYRFQRFVWSMRDVADGRAKRLLAETFNEQRVAAGAKYESVLSLDDERVLRRRLAN